MSHLDVEIIYLEIHERPSRPSPTPPRADVEVRALVRPSTGLYRSLYEKVGGPWLWYERKLLDDDQLAAAIHAPGVEIFELRVGNETAGYVELDGRSENETEIAYFGLTPAFIGQGLGRYLLAWAIDRAFSRPIRRLWLHTCNLDHPRALPTYLAAGFSEFARELTSIADPRDL